MATNSRKERPERTNQWEDKRAIVLVRQINDKDGCGSTEAQVDFMSRSVIDAGMRVVDKVVLEGVTGSLPGRREDLEQLLERRRTKRDFDVIAVQLTDRLTRGGGGHGMWFEHECLRHGVEVHFAGEAEAHGPYRNLIQVAKYDAAHDVSVKIGQRSTQGRKHAQKAGLLRTAGQTPIGCHRLYVGADGRPTGILRNLPDGRQELLHPETREVIGRYGSVGKKSRNRYKKQRNEYALLIPGDADQVRAVRVMFYLWFKRGWRGGRIADFLNRNAVPSPKGKEWSQRQVDVICENEAYTGFTYSDQVYSGRFVKGDADRGYEDLGRGRIELATARWFKPVLRPFDEWTRIDQPHLHDFLPSDVRALTIEGQAAMWRKRLDPTQASARPKHAAKPGSAYLLSGKLVAVQDDGKEPLTGTLCGRADAKTEYYRHLRSKRGRRKGSVYNNLIRAEPLHKELLRVLRETLLAAPDLRGTLTELVAEHRRHADEATVATDALEREKAEVGAQIGMILGTLTGAARKVAQAQLDQLGRRCNQIEAELAERRRSRTSKQKKVDQVVEQVINRLQRLGDELERLSPEPLRRLLNELLLSARVDLATKAVEFQIAAPQWALARLEPISGVCPTASSWSSIGGWTHRQLIVTFDCEYRQVRGSQTQPPCYECRRRAA